jgi:hypothetical protein
MERATIPSLPFETLRRCIRLATNLPEPFETSFEATLSEEGHDIHPTIYEAMPTKLACSRVCKTFHEITDEFLYEAIVLKEHHRVRPLARLLAGKSFPGSRLARGEYCRRLDVCVGHGRLWKGEDWAWGSFTLWGLIPPCPNLRILVISPLRITPINRSRPTTKYLAIDEGATLWKCIAATCGHRLLRLDVNYVDIRPSDLKQLLRACPALQVALFNGVPEDHNSSPPDYSERLNTEYRLHTSDLAEYNRARMTYANWPTKRGDSSLPSLHTLDVTVDNLPKLFMGLRFPNLRAAHVKGYLRGPIALQSSWDLLVNTVLISSQLSITHLSLRALPSQLEPLLTELPNLVQLTLYAMAFMDDWRWDGKIPNHILQTIRIFRPDSGDPGLIAHSVQDVLNLKKQGVLAALSRVIVLGDCTNARLNDVHFQEWNKEPQRDAFRALGVTLETGPRYDRTWS